MTTCIAMWSGPRNISTAMMRSWENRPDCTVVDEPFYACYLQETGLEHPCRKEILASQSTSREEVVGQLAGNAVTTPLYYQKHMTHHIPRGFDMGWCADFRHCFLIRDPAEVIASYLNKMPAVSEDDIGIVRQVELFEEITALTGKAPAVIDSNDVLRDPAGIMEQVCRELGVAWLPEAMLNWPPGPRDSDGVWAPYWYGNVEASMGFDKYQPRSVELSGQHQLLADKIQSYYAALAENRLR